MEEDSGERDEGEQLDMGSLERRAPDSLEANGAL